MGSGFFCTSFYAGGGFRTLHAGRFDVSSYAECDNLLDAIQIALEQINNSILWDTGDFNGAIIQLETVSQSLAWVQPLFEDSVNFMNLTSTVTDMISI